LPVSFITLLCSVHVVQLACLNLLLTNHSPTQFNISCWTIIKNDDEDQSVLSPRLDGLGGQFCSSSFIILLCSVHVVQLAYLDLFLTNHSPTQLLYVVLTFSLLIEHFFI